MLEGWDEEGCLEGRQGYVSTGPRCQEVGTEGASNKTKEIQDLDAHLAKPVDHRPLSLSTE